METRITDLEIRLTHNDAAMDELTRVVLTQEREVKRLNKEIEQLKTALKELSATLVAPESEETPPPHY